MLLLNKGYNKNSELHKDFLAGKITEKKEYFSDDKVEVGETPPFPIYMTHLKEDELRDSYRDAILTFIKRYLLLDRSVHMDGRFWHTLFLTKHRDYIINKYPEVKELKAFRNIVVKAWNWENYVYKVGLAATYGQNAYSVNKDKIKGFINILTDNLDIFNYIIKYQVFKCGHLIINLLEIIDEENFSDLFKRRIRHESIGNKDLRYGREIVYELNKAYPIIMSPVLEKEELRDLIKVTTNKILARYPLSV